MNLESKSVLSTDAESNLEFEFVRATENAALNVLNWLGHGEKEQPDAAAHALRIDPKFKPTAWPKQMIHWSQAA